MALLENIVVFISVTANYKMNLVHPKNVSLCYQLLKMSRMNFLHCRFLQVTHPVFILQIHTE